MKNLYAALLEAQEIVLDAPYDGHNAHHDYHYTDSDTRCEIGKAALNACGLVLAATDLAITSERVLQLVKTPQGPQAIEVTQYTMARRFRLCHAPSGEQLEWTADWPLDLESKATVAKAAGAADTILQGYAYRALLRMTREGRGIEQPLEDRVHPLGIDPEPTCATCESTNKCPKCGFCPKCAYVANRKRSGGCAGCTEQMPDEDTSFDPKELEEDKADKEFEEARQRFEEAPKTSDPKAILLALSMGCIAGDDLSPAGSAILCALPKDPTVGDLVNAGWEKEIAEELCALDPRSPVHRNTSNQLCGLACKRVGVKGRAQKAWLTKTLEAVGVDVKGKAPTNGYQLRLWALSIPQAQEATA